MIDPLGGLPVPVAQQFAISAAGYSREFSVGAVAVGEDGSLFIADGANHRVRMVDPRGIITTVAGQGAPAPLDTCCKDPVDLAVDRSGGLYVSDLAMAMPSGSGVRQFPRVWFINRGSQPVTVRGKIVAPGALEVAAGNGSSGFGGDGGPAADAELQDPMSIALNGQGELYIGGVGGLTKNPSTDGLIRAGDIRKVDPSGVITTIAGTGEGAFNGDGKKARLTNVSFPIDLAFDRCGDLLVADPGAGRIRRLSIASCTNAGASSPAPRGSSRLGPLLAVGALVVLGALALAVALSKRRRLKASKGPGD